MPATLTDVPATDARHSHQRHGEQPFTCDTPADLATWEARAAQLRQHLRVVLGLETPLAAPPLKAHISVCGRGDGYLVERVWFQSQAGFLCTGNLYRPPDPTEPIPAILNPHGHWRRGRLEDGPLGSIRARCITFARMGMAALAYDMVGYNDSRQIADHHYSSRKAALWGLSSLALQTRNSIRAVDFLLSLPYVDPARLGCTGASGGGSQTFMLAALDPRVATVAPVNMVSAHFQGGCQCENAPGLRTDTHNVEIAALAAPRPLLLVSATGDWTVNTLKVEYPAIRRVYELYGAADHVQCVQQDAPHNYNAVSRAHVYRWFARWFLGADDLAPETEQPFELHSDAQLRVFAPGTLPAGYPEGPHAMRHLVDRARAANDAEPPSDARSADGLARLTRQRLWHILSIEAPQLDDVFLSAAEGQVAGPAGQPVVLGLSSRGSRVEGRLWAPACSQPTSLALVLHPAGVEGLLDAVGYAGDWLSAVLGGNRAVLAISPLGTTAPPAQALARRDHDWFWATFNPPLLGEQVLDVLTALVALRQRWLDLPTTAIGVCGGGAWALLAGAMDTQVARVFADVGAWAWDDEEGYLGDLFAPCLARYGLLPAVAASLAPRPLALRVRDAHNGLQWPEATYQAHEAEDRLRLLTSPKPDDLRAFLAELTELESP